jgi:photosystem II stability/assembly factor-like uncharacterized protein
MHAHVSAGGLAAALLWSCALSGAHAANPWTASGPVSGAFLPTVAYSASGTTAFAGGIGVIWRTGDDGLLWTAAALPALYAHSLVLSIAPDPANSLVVLASTTDLGVSGTAAGDAVLVSDDGGKTWTAGAGLTNQVESGNTQYPYNITWDPNVPGTAYAATAAGETGDIYRTTNSGKNWALRYFAGTTAQPIPFGPIAAVPTKPTSIYIAATDFNYASDGDEYIASSTNGAAAFSFVQPLNYVGYSGYGTVLTRFGYDPKSATTVYALVSGVQSNTLSDLAPYIQFWWTPNNGNNWVNRVKGLPLNAQASALAVEPVSRAVLLPVCCADHHQLFQSTNQGASWSALGIIPASSFALAVKPGGSATAPATLLNAGRGGALGSIDGGKSWGGRATGLTQPNFADVIADPATPEVLFAGTKGGVFRSSNGGATFAAASVGLTDQNIVALALDAKASPHVLYAASLTGIYRWENPATAVPAWTEITPPGMKGLEGAYALAVDGSTAGRLYVSNTQSILLANGNSTPREIYRTDDFGAKWVTTGFNAATGNNFPQAMIADPKAPGTIYATAEDFPAVYKSINAGASFTDILDGQGGSKFLIGQGDALNPRTLYLLSTDPNSGQPVILRSTNGGQTWDQNTSATPGGNVLLDLAADPVTSALYALVYIAKSSGGFNPTYTYSLGVYESTNRGFLWTPITGNLSVPLVISPSSGVATPTFLRATGKTLAVAAPLEKTLFLQTLP